MTDPITPPFELMNQWYKKACKDPYNGGKFIMAPVLKDISNSAAQWGADQELELTLKLMRTLQIRGVDYIHRVRRPGLSSKTPSLKERLTTAIVNGDERLAIQLLDEALPND